MGSLRSTRFGEPKPPRNPCRGANGQYQPNPLGVLRRKQAHEAARNPPLPVLPGVPLVWDPGLVYLKLVQLWRLTCRQHVQTVRGIPWVRTTETPESGLLDGYAEECGIYRAPDWRPRIYDRRDGHIMEHTRPKPVTRCPACAGLSLWLWASDGRWVCSRCAKWPNTHAELSLATYLCGLRIGLRGTGMKRRKLRLTHRLDLLARKARTASDLWVLGIAGPVLTWRKRRSRKPMGRWVTLPEPGPVFVRLAPTIISSAIDSLLHPDVYLARFGPGGVSR